MTRPTPADLVAARREGGLVRTLQDIAVIARRNVLLDRRNPAATLVTAAFPISLMVVFTASFAKVVLPDGSYADYAQFLVPFSTVQGLLINTVNIGSTFYEDLDSGMDMRLRAMPIARFAALGGRLVAAAVRLLLQVVAIVLVGHLLGFRFQGGLLDSLGFLLLPVVFTTSFAWVALLIAVRANSAESVAATMNPWILPLTFLSIGYVPLEGFPDWAQGFVSVNPISIEAQAMRGLASGEPVLSYILTALLWSLGLSVVFGTLTVRTYQRRYR
ncbi:ABC transporter permease [Romeria aff. gracilis LEGE 07310]|uniref:Transport permease protein n=1 Tax=Vasconcelosia minhoensis LEGE 07310 TaxID=915328 RepID=A0A8J7AL72_9CYAN|nr:ABC transporter permease [Romeria gracilis]MBE9076186.1 ABC transporter permease [Romeria aff. gracilis LEGE 07310]